MFKLIDSKLLKSLYSFIFISLLFLGCQEEEKKLDILTLENALKDTVFLYGKIDPFNVNKDELFFKINTQNFLSKDPKNFSIPIQKDGHFQLNFPVPIGGTFTIKYNSQKIKVKTNQQDSLQLLLSNFDKKNTAKLVQQIQNQDTISIPHEAITSTLKKKVLLDTLLAKANSNSIVMKFKENTFIEKYQNENYWDLLFIAKKDLVTEATQKKKFLSLEKDSLQVAFLFDYLYTKTKGYEREIILAKYIHELINKKPRHFSTVFYHSYMEKMESNKLKHFITKIFDQANNANNQAIHFLSLNANKNILQTIKERHKGKAIYIDFWATWCIPCLKEMSIYPTLNAELGEQVAFVYLAINSPEKDWHSMIKQWNILGDHYLLSQAEYDMLHRLIYIETIPHYILLNKKGVIVNDFAPRPSIGEGKTMNPILIKSVHQILIE